MAFSSAEPLPRKNFDPDLKKIRIFAIPENSGKIRMTKKRLKQKNPSEYTIKI